MNLDEFGKILIGANTPNPEQNQFHTILMQFRSQNYSQFISFNLMFLQNLVDINLAMLVTTIIYNEVKTGKIFEDQELENSFLELFLNAIPAILESPLFLENIKMIISTILSLIGIKRYHESSDTTIQQYIVQLYQSNTIEYETFVINCIMEIIVGCKEFGGFQPEVISNFILMQLQKESSYIPRCKLFFGIAMQTPNDPNLSAVFQAHYLQTPIPEKFMHDFLNTVIAFSELNALFFHNHLTTFIPMLCEMAIDPNNDNRNMALFVFSAISQGAPQMCQAVPEFYIPVTQCLVRVMSEVTLETPIDYDPNSLESCVIARDVFKAIVDVCECEIYVKCVEAIFIQNLKQTAEANNLTENPYQAILMLPWQFVYANVSALSETFNNGGFFAFFDVTMANERDYRRLIQLVQRFIPLLQMKQTPLILRVEILNLYQLIASQVAIWFLNLAGHFLIQILRDLILNDDSHIIKIYAAETLVALLKPLSNSQDEPFENFFTSTFEMIIEMLSSSPPYLYKPLILSLTRLSLMGQPFLPHLDFYITVLLNIYNQTGFDHSDLKLTIIQSMSLVCTNFCVPKENVEAVFQKFLNDILEIGQMNQIDEFSNDIYMNTILKVMKYLNENAVQFSLSILPRALEKANEDIQIIQVQKLVKNEQNSMFTEIQGTELYYRNFALNSDIVTVSNSLAMLSQVLKCLKLNARPFIQDFINVNQKWILNEYQIENVKNTAWQNLNLIIEIFENEYEINELLCILFNDFNATIDTTTIKVGSSIIETMNRVIKEIKHPWCNVELISTALIKLEIFMDNVFNHLRMSIENIDRFQCSHDSREEGMADQTLSLISLLFTQFLDHYPEITLTFMQEHRFIEKITNLLESSDITIPSHGFFIIFAYEIITPYICKIRNIELAMNWLLTLFSLGEKCEGDPSCKSFQYMIPVFESFKLPEEFADSFDKRFEDFLIQLDFDANHEEDEDEKYIYIQWAMPAFAVFIQTNIDIIDTQSAIDTFCNIGLLSDENEISDYGFAFLIKLCKERNDSAFSRENFEDIIEILTSNINNDRVMKPETLQDLQQFLRDIVCDPQFGPRVMNRIHGDAIKESNQLILELMRLGQNALAQNQLNA